MGLVVSKDSEDVFGMLVTVLERGDIVIMQGDTIYGFWGIAPDAGKKIAELKNRPDDKEFLMVIPDESWVSRFSDTVLPEELTKYWPGALTVIMKAKKGISETKSDTVALRVPDDLLIREVLYELDKPLYSTSVNISGSKELNDIYSIMDAFGKKVDLVVISEDAPEALPSTIVDITSGDIIVVREGSLKIEY